LASTLVPGETFGECDRGFISASYAHPVKSIDTALERIGNLVACHKK